MQRTFLRDYAALYQIAIATALRILRREPLLGIKRLLLPVSYWRFAEFAYVFRQLPSATGTRVLDLGSPKELAFFLARSRYYDVTATDILTAEIERSMRYARALALSRGSVVSQVQDGRKLDYADATFDAAFSVSVLEHIPDGGDSLAIAELVRVVKPGGRVVITVPYDRRYRETFVQGPVYERRQIGAEPIFFERHYDEAALERRLIAPSGARVVDREIWGEHRVRMDELLARSGHLRTLLSPLEPALSAAFLKRLDHGTGQPMAMFFTLEVMPR